MGSVVFAGVGYSSLYAKLILNADLTIIALLSQIAYIPGTFVNQEIVPDLILHFHFINLPVQQIETYGTLFFNLWDLEFCCKPTSNRILLF